MKVAIACLGALALAVLPPTNAFAQESPAGDSTVDPESPPTQAEPSRLRDTRLRQACGRYEEKAGGRATESESMRSVFYTTVAAPDL